jgi:hypothetical protein
MSATALVQSPSSGGARPHAVRDALRSRPAAAVAAVVLLLAWVTLIATHHSPALPVARAAAVHRALTDPSSAPTLSRLRFTRTDVTPVDGRYELVGFYDGPRLVATVGVSGRGAVLDTLDLTREKYTYGSGIAHDIRMLILLCAVFVLMTAVWPLWRLRNLDVLAAVSSAASIVLWDRWTLDQMVLVSYPALLYLAGRCAWLALGRRRPVGASVPLFERLTARWAPRRQRRLLRLAAAACGLIVAMVGLSSLHVIDVGYAVMEGATAIVHGAAPYGHIPDVLHGDTYPIASYLLYVPFAWLSPVHDQWDDADFTLVVAVLGALGAAWGMRRACGSLVRARPRAAVNAGDLAGLRLAIAWLTFPPLLVTVSTGTTDVALAAMLLGALLLWRRPAISTTVLAASAWFKVIPIALLPIWLARLRGGSLARALGGVVAVSAVMVAALLALGGVDAIARMIHGVGYQASRSSPHILWTLIGSVPLQQLAQAATLALIGGAAVRVARDGELANDRTRIAALCAAILLGLQLSANYWTYMYLVWVFPFMALAVLGSHPGTVLGSHHAPVPAGDQPR